MSLTWQPSFGAVARADGVHFRVWSPTSEQVELVLPGPSPQTVAMVKSREGIFEATVPGASAGTRYQYRLDGKGPFPDPASRFQPEGVHGPSQVVDPMSFGWTDQSWNGIEQSDLVIYELHVGSFTSAGTYAAAAEKLPHLVELGITAVELMPLADFPGQRGWGYDGVCLYSPARCYGEPDELRRFVNEAHKLGLAVLLDVVYNHLGPDGNYLGQFSSHYFSTTHHTDWGTGPNFDGPHSDSVVRFFIDNALHWIHDYHLDGLRLDATHAILDESEPHFLAKLAEQVHELAEMMGRRVVVIAEDERNLARLVKPKSEAGYGLDGVWADDLHHQVRSALTGESDGYYADYSGTAVDIAETISQNWFYTGQTSPSRKIQRGSKADGEKPYRFVVCIQNHDQIGNRAFGERLNHQVDQSAYRAASALLLLGPQTPLLFMGQEWAASSPFLYFTDHNPELGKLVTEGRRREFKHFKAFADPHIRTWIPDPQSATTFAASKLNWDELDHEPHAGTLRLYQDLLRLRNCELALRGNGRFTAEALADSVVLLKRQATSGEHLLIVVALTPGAVAAINQPGLGIVLTTEDERYAKYQRRPDVFVDGNAAVVHFPCPAAVVFRQLAS